jgi:antirestriction protein ArdC
MDQTNRTAGTDRAADLHRQLEAQLAELVTSQDWSRMLATAAKFHHYSPSNVLLILCQRPDATRVAGYRTWQSLGRQVRKGEHGIKILAPVVRKVETDDGDEVRRVVAFTTATVFDIASTDGEPVGLVSPSLLEGEAPAGLWDDLAAQVAALGFTLERGDCGSANGWCSFESTTIRVRDDVDEAQATKTLAHELAHAMLHAASDLSRAVKEVEAESVAFVVCQALGLGTSGYTLPYVGSWSGGDLELVHRTADRVISTASAILGRLEGAETLEVAA